MTEELDDREMFLQCVELGLEGAVKEYLARNRSRYLKARTALIEACRRNQLSLVRLILSFGAQVEVKDIFNHSPISYAQKYGNQPLLYLLVRTLGTRPPPTPEDQAREEQALINRPLNYSETSLIWP